MKTRENEVEGPKKAKATVYMTEEEETLLNELFIKRLENGEKPTSQPSYVKEFDFYSKKKLGLPMAKKSLPLLKKPKFQRRITKIYHIAQGQNTVRSDKRSYSS